MIPGIGGRHFQMTFDSDWIEKGSILSPEGDPAIKIKILSKPKVTWWRRWLAKIGITYFLQWHYKAELV